jgi:hypothetical protein
VLAVGDDARRVLDECPASLVDRLADVVLVMTDASTALRLVRSGGGHVHVFDSEDSAGAALELFTRSPLVALGRGPR